MASKSPRINVTVTQEQHALLLELAELQGGSASGFLRQQLDVSTPLLRSVVPLMRRAAEDIELTRAEAHRLLEEPLRALRQLGLDEQLSLLGEPPDYVAPDVAAFDATSGSEAVRKRGKGTS